VGVTVFFMLQKTCVRKKRYRITPSVGTWRIFLTRKWVILVRPGEARISVAQIFDCFERVQVFWWIASWLCAIAVKPATFKGMLGP
jgi:hypothetical protein